MKTLYKVFSRKVNKTGSMTQWKQEAILDTKPNTATAKRMHVKLAENYAPKKIEMCISEVTVNLLHHLV